MNRKTSVSVVLILGLFVASQASAEYVSDRLYLGLYAVADSTGSPIKTLNSGTQLEVLQKQGDFMQVRLKDGTQGWVRTEFISKDVPAKQQLLEVTAERDKLRNQSRRMGNEQAALKRLERQLKQANQSIKELKQKIVDQQNTQSEPIAPAQPEEKQKEELENLQGQLHNAEATINELQEQVETLESQPGTNRDSSKSILAKIGWMLFSMLLCLTAGILIGIRWLSARVRQRFNGLKIW